MTAYLTVAEFKLRSIMPAVEIDALETVAAGWLDAQLAAESEYIDARLRKRYAVPFTAPVPSVIQRWLTRIVTEYAFRRRGVDPTDRQYAASLEDANTARTELKEAADSNVGLFDLPLREDQPGSGITKGGPRSYSEQSPYVFTDQQAQVGHQEDQARGGTSGG